MARAVLGEELQSLVSVWFDEHYPEWKLDWLEGEFEAYASLSIEIKMIPAFKFLEHNIINGGWAQFLWNGFGSWRQLIETAREGYVLIGGASKQLMALDELYTICERNEVECEEMLETEDGSMVNFGNFTSRSYNAAGNDWEKLLWPGTDIYWRRLSWLGEHESRIRGMLEV